MKYAVICKGKITLELYAEASDEATVRKLVNDYIARRKLRVKIKQIKKLEDISQ